jgi:hypothetical protein
MQSSGTMTIKDKGGRADKNRNFFFCESTLTGYSPLVSRQIEAPAPWFLRPIAILDDAQSNHAKSWDQGNKMCRSARKVTILKFWRLHPHHIYPYRLQPACISATRGPSTMVPKTDRHLERRSFQPCKVLGPWPPTQTGTTNVPLTARPPSHLPLPLTARLYLANYKSQHHGS